ncbi:MAG: motility protein A [Lachnospiraceae bacterium]|nr:motility protein A [Lachnospiraceae bacterium]
MDITSILGLVIGFALIVYGIGFGALGNFVDVQSLAIVFGGSLAAVIASYPLGKLKSVIRHTGMLLSGKKYDPAVTIDQLVDMAQIARKNGLLALEEKANALDDPFFKQAVMLVVDAMEADKVREMLEGSVDNMAARHEDCAGIWDKAGGYAPAFGMIGTLIGLINMLKNMDVTSGGSSSIGQDMSVALITTFYGCVLANLIYLPIGKKLRIRNEEEILYKQIIIEGVLGIQTGDNPKNLKERLVSFLDTKQQLQILESDGSGGA